MHLRALSSGVGLWLAACAVGTEPTLIYDTLSGGGAAGGGAAGADAAGSSGAPAEVGGSAGSAMVGGTLAGSGGALGAGGLGGGGTGGGGAGGGGASGGGGTTSAGSGGAAGSGGMPPQPEPQSISVGTTRNATAKHSPSAGGSAYSDDCPASQVLIGFRGTIDGGLANLRSVQGICATLNVVASAPYAITTAQAGMLPVREAAGNTIENAMCPANQVIVGFSGRTATYIEALAFRCAPLSITGTAPNFQLSLGNVTTSSPIGGENAGSPFNAIDCPAGEVAVSQVPNAGSAIDNFGLKCAALSLIVD